MPNYCNNITTFQHTDKSLIDSLENEVKKGDDARIMQLLYPGPEDWDYNWCVTNWGTKWDAIIVNWTRIDDNIIEITFDTAWNPPLDFYHFIESKEWSITSYYDEPGCQFTGIYSNGKDEYYEYSSMTVEEMYETIPRELNEMFCMIELRQVQEEDDTSYNNNQ